MHTKGALSHCLGAQQRVIKTAAVFFNKTLRQIGTITRQRRSSRAAKELAHLDIQCQTGVVHDVKDLLHVCKVALECNGEDYNVVYIN